MKKLIITDQILTGADVPNWDCYLVFIPRHIIMAGYYGITLAVFSFPDNNVNNCQWIFAKLGVCFDIVETWFGIVNGQISSIFDSYLPVICPNLHFWMTTLVNVSGFSPNLVFIDIVKIWFGIADGQISSIFYSHLHFWIITSTYQWIFTKLGICIVLILW